MIGYSYLKPTLPFRERVSEDGGEVYDSSHLTSTFTNITEFLSPSLLNTCDTGKEGLLYSVIPNGVQYSTLLSDIAGIPTAAYSLRKVVSTYEGPAIRARKQVSSSDVYEEIGFDSSGNLDTLSLTTFASNADNGNVLVQTWYDQAGSNDATQTTAANQPKIVSAGALVTENGKVALDFDGVGNYLSFNSSITLAVYSNFGLIKKDTTLNKAPIIGLDFGISLGVWDDGNIYENNGTSFVAVSCTNNTNQNLFSVIKKGNTLADFSAKQNGSLLGSYTGTPFTSITVLYIGGRVGAADYVDGKLQELIIYNSDKSSLRTAIEGNINGYYSIYTP
jgi:hypothetical protein